MHDIIPPKWICLESCDLFKFFWDKSDKMSLTVQQEIVCGLSNGTIADALA